MRAAVIQLSSQDDVAANLERVRSLVAEAARAQFANETAIRLFDRALACLGSQPNSDLAARLHIWHDLGSVYELIGDFEAGQPRQVRDLLARDGCHRAP